MQEIDLIITNLKAEMANVGSTPFSESAYNAFETGPQQDALNRLKGATPGSPHTGAGYTDPASCNSHYPDDLSKCLRHALEAHEGHHATVCKTVKGSYSEVTSPFTDYRNGKSLADAYQEEITSYYLELDVLSVALRDLPDSCKPKEWYLKWTLTIDGKSDAKSKIKWKVHHEYTGNVMLSDMGQSMQTASLSHLTPQQAKQMTPAQAMAMVKAMKKVHLWLHKSPPPQIMVPIEATIEDYARWKGHDRGEGDSFEDTTTESTWKAEHVADEIQNFIQLEVDEQAKTYNITIPVAAMSQAKLVTESDTVEVNRSALGWGNKPTHEGPTTTTKPMSVSSFPIPANATIIDKGGHIHHDKDLPFAPKEDILRFDSGPLPMDPKSTFLKDMPGAQDNVKIQVIYVLSKTPQH